MSFRRYVHYCAWCCGIAGYAGWALSRWLPIENWFLLSACKGCLFGLLVGATLGFVDARWYLPAATAWRTLGHVLTVAAVGALGGMLGRVFAEAVYRRLQFEMFRLPGWFFTGFIIGAGLGVAEMVARMAKRERVADSVIRMRRGSVGGALGGFLGGCLYLLFIVLSHSFFTDTDPLWSPDAWGSVALGLCIGLGTALTQIQSGESAP